MRPEPQLLASEGEQHSVRTRRNLWTHRGSLNVKKYQTLAPCTVGNWFCSGSLLAAYCTRGSGTQSSYRPILFLRPWLPFQPSSCPRGRGGAVERAQHPAGRRLTSLHATKSSVPSLLFSQLGKAEKQEANSSPHFSALRPLQKPVVRLFPLPPG